MGRFLNWRTVRNAVLAAAVAIPLGSVAWGQSWGHSDDDRYYRQGDVRERGFQSGYRDGLNRGQYDSERGRRFKFKNDDWEDSRGYEHWMGNKREYKYAYRDGYENGYRRGYGAYGGRYRDRDDYRHHDRDDWR
jgi:hypothetical protein